MHSARWALGVYIIALASAHHRHSAVAQDDARYVAPPHASLEARFLNPPDAVKPWCYWWWLNANVTRESITRDLEGMKAKGIGGFLLFDVTAYGHHLVPAPERKIGFMSPQWRELVRFAMTEADRLGLKMSMNLSTCGGALRAPWDTKEHAPKRLIVATAEVVGPATIRVRLARPEKEYFWDAAVVAAQHAEEEGESPQAPSEKSAAASGLNGPWSPAVTRIPKQPVTVGRAVDLTGKVDARGGLAWDVPEGRWTVMRFACERITEGEQGDVDILSTEAVEEHFRRMGKAILKDAGPLAGKTLTHFYNVSWEGVNPTWTPGFDAEFRKHRGYDIHAFLPVLARCIVGDRDVSQRFLRDYCRTLGDCFLTNCYGRFSDLCHEAGLLWHSESGGPWRPAPMFEHSEPIAFWGRNDMPQGEFWWPTGRSNARRTAMAAHVYGRPVASIEAFTHMQPHWSAWPASLKPLADAAYCDGVNWFIWHTFSASPKEFGRPGIVYFAGTHLNSNVTWWDQSGPFLTYLARCQAMLRRGRFVADVCCYTGDRNQVNWSRGETWSKRASLELPKGYTYDLLSTEALLDRLSVEDGHLVLPDGMRYRLLVLDLEEETIPLSVLVKIAALAERGATVVLGTRRPTRTPGLKDYPDCDREVRRLAGDLWGDGAKAIRPRGRGKVICGTALGDALDQVKIAPDYAGPWDSTHRTEGEIDLYFLAGSGLAECVFRVGGKKPELWDPYTGQVRDAVVWRRTEDGRTLVPLSLPECGSVFVVFRRAPEAEHVTAFEAPEGALEIVERTPKGVRVRVWKEGTCSLRRSDGEELSFSAGDLPEPIELAGPWQVRFEAAYPSPQPIVLKRLAPLDEHPEESIRHFSGTATYRKTFTLEEDQAAALLRLDLGEARHVAEVRLNGRDLGVVWTAPWSLDISGIARAGENRLEIDVTNLWVNRLIGDAALPQEKRVTQTNVALQRGNRTLRPFQGYGSTDPLVRSGLLGPIRIQFGAEREVRWK